MSLVKMALVAGTVAAGLAVAPAFSQQRGVGADPITDGRYPPPAEREMMFYQTNGAVKMMRTDATGHNEIMKHARALADGAAIYRSGGKFYLVENKKMADGKMLFDQMGPWNLSDRQTGGQQ